MAAILEEEEHETLFSSSCTLEYIVKVTFILGQFSAYGGHLNKRIHYLTPSFCICVNVS